MTRFDPLLDALPAAQVALWPSLRPLRELGFVLYGGTAVALWLGHRVSVDFDFFCDRHFTPDRLRKRLSFLAQAQTLDSAPDTLTVSLRPAGQTDPVKLSFFGGLRFGRVGEPSMSRDGVLCIASMIDLMATKLEVLHERVSAKDYIDLAAMIEHGVSLPTAMSAARAMYGPAFNPAITLKAMTWFKGGDLDELDVRQRQILAAAAADCPGALPHIELRSARLGFDGDPEASGLD